MLLRKLARSLLTTVIVMTLSGAMAQSGYAYEKAVEGPDVVKEKLFPKKSTVELDAKLGSVLNGSYIQTFMFNGSVTYFWSENWGFSAEGVFALNSDKAERACIETFYNDPNFAIGAQCGGSGNLSQDSKGDANFGLQILSAAKQLPRWHPAKRCLLY